VIDPIVLWACAAVGASALAVAPEAALLGALGVALVVWRRAAPPGVVAVGALLLAAQGARGMKEIERARALHAGAVAALTPPAVCVGRAEILGSPVASVRGPEGERAAGVYTRASVRVHSGTCDGRPIPPGLVARVYDLPDDLRRGDEVDLTAKLLPVHLWENAEVPSVWPGIARSGIVASGAALDVVVVERPLSLGGAIDAARAHVRRRILASYAPGAAELARALVIGETDLTDEDARAFQDSGLLHLLAVSGTHLVLVVSAWTFALRLLLSRITALAARVDAGRIAAAAGIGAAWLYADFAGGGGSAVRAAAMLTVALLAKALGRRPSAGRSLALGLLAVALVDPLVALDVSFGLSAGATAGLVLLGGLFTEKLTGWLAPADGASESMASPAEAPARAAGESMASPAEAPLARRPTSPSPVESPRSVRLRAALVTLGRGALRHVLGSVGTTLAATLGSTPAMLRFSPRLPLLGVIANVLAAPLGELIALPVCLAHAVAGPVAPLERALALAGSGALLAVRAIARAAASAGHGLGVPPPCPAQLAAIAIAAAALVTARNRRARLAALAMGAGALLLLEIVQVRAGAPRGVLRVTALDVAQGDSILVDFPDGRSMLIDGGGMVGNPVDPGARVALPVLAARRRSRVDVLALTHPHPDHFTGLATVAKELPFGELWETGQGEMLGVKGPYAALLQTARARGAPVRRPADLCGKPRMFGAARVEVLWPCPGATPAMEANNASLVMRIDLGKRSALLVGDAEHEAERALLESGARLQADLLKVGHHGSRTSSSPDFLRAVSPSTAMISCGVRNRFGHPHPDAMTRLAAARVAVHRTDRGGEIVWETDGETTRIRRP
jgi:competence protein ComEC